MKVRRFMVKSVLEGLPGGVQSKVKEVLGDNNGVALRLPAGRWTAFYEQFEPPQANMVALYRNVVLKHSPSSSPEGAGRG